MILNYSARFLVLFLILYCTALSSQSKKIKSEVDLVISFNKSTIVDSSCLGSAGIGISVC
jgi:hypothetical protein